jgi:hypothetical protein
MRNNAVYFLALAVTAGGTWSPAADSDKVAFPKKGSAIPGSFSPFVINAKGADGKPVARRHSLVTQFGLKPVVLVFAHNNALKDKAVFDFLAKLDKAVGEGKEVELRGGVVFLCFDSKRDKEDISAKELLEVDQERDTLVAALKEKTEGLKNLLVGIDDPKGPKGYGIGKKDYVTVILYYKYRVVTSHVYRIGDDDESGFNAKTTGQVVGEVQKWITDLKKKPAPRKKKS